MVPTITAIQQIAKDQNATLVEYSVIFDNLLLIWVIQPTGEIDLVPVDLATGERSLSNLSASIQQQMTLAQQSGSTEESTLVSLVRSAHLPSFAEAENLNALKPLHNLLIKPIAHLLPNNPEDRVIFIPHQSLFRVPFTALMDESGNYLIEKHTILTAPSIQSLSLPARRPQSPGPFRLCEKWSCGPDTPAPIPGS